MNSQQAYNAWTANYDAGIDKTRDIEAVALKETLSQVDLSYCQVLEIGCGTGKNTGWLLLLESSHYKCATEVHKKC